MTAHSPPVPPQQQSDKAPRSEKTDFNKSEKSKSPAVDSNTNRFGSIKQNTTNKGYQQDR